LLLPITCYAAVNNITEEDGSPSVYPWKLKVSNGTLTDNGDGTASITIGAGGAPTDAAYITKQAEAGLSAEFALGSLGNGLLKNTTVAGVGTPSIAVDGTDFLSPTTGLKLDQTAPQTVSGGAPVFADNIVIGDNTSGDKTITFDEDTSNGIFGYDGVSFHFDHAIEIAGNYYLKWLDNTRTTTYAYIQGNSSNLIISAVNVPFQIQYGAVGGAVGCSLDTSGNWVFNYDAGDCDFSIYKQTAGVAYNYTAGTDTHTFSGHVNMETVTANHTLATPADHAYSGISATYTAGEALTMGDLVYYKSDGKVYKAKGDATSTMPCMGLATTDIAINTSVVILLKGYFQDASLYNFTVGGQASAAAGLIYVSAATAGLATQTIPSASTNIVQIVGQALTADIIYFDPCSTYVEID